MRVLLIEDDTVLGAAVRDQITADGHSIDWAARLDAADEYLNVAAYDLFLLDLMLPDGPGRPFLRALRKRGDVTPVIILTTLDQISDWIDGHVSHLPKNRTARGSKRCAVWGIGWLHYTNSWVFAGAVRAGACVGTYGARVG